VLFPQEKKSAAEAAQIADRRPKVNPSDAAQSAANYRARPRRSERALPFMAPAANAKAGAQAGVLFCDDAEFATDPHARLERSHLSDTSGEAGGSRLSSGQRLRTAGRLLLILRPHRRRPVPMAAIDPASAGKDAMAVAITVSQNYGENYCDRITVTVYAICGISYAYCRGNAWK
jgi:hypothetical protein